MGVRVHVSFTGMANVLVPLESERIEYAKIALVLILVSSYRA